jgi:hypothetical protein
MMFVMVCRVTPNRRPRAEGPSVAKRARISRTFSIVSFAAQLCSPCAGLGSRIRPRVFASRALSRAVPSRRWAGLQHGGLSHACNTKLVGSFPVLIHRATRCASADLNAPIRRERIIMRPYPSICLCNIHGQHSFGPRTATPRVNRVISSGVSGAPIAALRRAVSRRTNTSFPAGFAPALLRRPPQVPTLMNGV